jgi:alpha-D-xyloside xylohydrolase
MKNLPPDFCLQQGKVVWEGDLQAKETGVYRFLLYHAGAATATAKLWIDGRLVADQYCVANAPAAAKLDIGMEAGRHHAMRLEWLPNGKDARIGLKALSPQPFGDEHKLSFSSETAERIDYYFIKGNTMDEVIKGYQSLSPSGEGQYSTIPILYKDQTREVMMNKSIFHVVFIKEKAKGFDRHLKT